MSLSVMLQFMPTGSQMIYAPATIFKDYYHGKAPKHLTLIFGQSTCTVPVKWHKRQTDTLYLTHDVRQQLGIPFAKRVNLRIAHERRWHLGPVIGVLSTHMISDGKEEPFGLRNPLFQQYMLNTPANGFYFVFAPQDVSLAQKRIKGYFYLSDSGNYRWRKLGIALPDVIYDRIPNRGSQQHLSVKQLQEEMKLLNIPWFNQGFFDKWEIHQSLLETPVRHLLPETSASLTPITIKHMLKSHSIIYLKPVTGSLGLGIYRISRLPRNGYVCHFHQQKHKKAAFSNIDQISRWLIQRLQNSKRKYIVQQGIPLLEFRGSRLDFRIHLNKNEKNRWQVVAIAAKAAYNESVTTHIRIGGSVMDPRNILTAIAGKEKAEQWLELLQRQSIAVAQAVEQTMPGPVGELGLDMGIDQAGKAWLFEVNSRPGHSIFKHPSLGPKKKDAMRLIFDYGRHLAGFRQDETAERPSSASL
jgi:hypothetical protein